MFAFACKLDSGSGTSTRHSAEHLYLAFCIRHCISILPLYRSIDHVFKDGNKVADKPAAYDRTSSELCIFETSSHVPAKLSRICKTDL